MPFNVVSKCSFVFNRNDRMVPSLRLVTVTVYSKAIIISQRIVIGIGVILNTGDHKVFHQALRHLTFLAVTFVHKIAKEAEGQGAKKVHEEILHGIGKPDIEITAVNEICRAVGGNDAGFNNVLDTDAGLDIVWVKGEGVDTG